MSSFYIDYAGGVSGPVPLALNDGSLVVWSTMVKSRRHHELMRSRCVGSGRFSDSAHLIVARSAEVVCFAVFYDWVN